MKHRAILGIFLISIILLGTKPVSSRADLRVQQPTPMPQPATDRDNGPPDFSNSTFQINHQGNSPLPPPDHDDTHFVTDTGAWLDRYLFQDDVPNGLLTFDIEIDRYYSQLILTSSIDAEGFLLPAVRQDLINKKLLPERGTLTLQVWDVDHDSAGCPEVDYVYINGNILQNSIGSGPATLSSGNETWSTWSIDFPIELLKFPTSKGSNGQKPTPVANEISVEIDVMCGPHNWAVEVDWGSIHIPSPIRPVIFAYGFTGDTSSFETFENFLLQDGIPSAGTADLSRGIYPIAQSSIWLAEAIKSATEAFGVDGVNIFAHSRGGLVSRHALRTKAVAELTDHLVTFSSPHHGTDLGTSLTFCNRFKLPDPADRERCTKAMAEFSVARIRNEFNYRGCVKEHWWSEWTGCRPRYVRQRSVDYKSVVGGPIDLGARTATYPWRADKAPFPSRANVDAQFIATHGGIKEKREVYQCAISYIDPTIYAQKNCPGSSTGVSDNPIQAASEMPFFDHEFQMVLNQEMTITAGSTEIVEAKIDGGNHVIFNVFSEDQAAFTLLDPEGHSIDPSVADSDPAIQYFAQQDGIWWYRYDITDPLVGIWQNVIQTSSDVFVNVLSLTDSTSTLYYHTVQYSYQPESLITLEAALINTAPIIAAQIQGVVTLPDNSVLTLTFYDDGTHGDVEVADGLHTTQFHASSSGGHAVIALEGVSGNTARFVQIYLGIVEQNAEIIGVSDEVLTDVNANTLYDALQLDLNINVISIGHFEIEGVLADNKGQPITSAHFSSLTSGGTPLPEGGNIIPLVFSGEDINQHGEDGPYVLSHLAIFDITGSAMEVDSAQDLYTTAPYTVNQFERPLIILGGGSESVTDLNGNGLYDQLTISIFFDLVNAGEYSWNGRIVNQRGVEIGWVSNWGKLDNLTPADFVFNGYAIGSSREDGPYTLRDVSIVQISGGNSTATFSELYTTVAYSYMEFEGGLWNVYIPVIMRNALLQHRDLYGTVTEKGLPLVGTEVSLRFFDGSVWSTYTTSLTDSNGNYEFSTLPQLDSDELRYVLWTNSDGNTNRMSSWRCWSIFPSTTDPSAFRCDFDLENVEMFLPSHGSNISLPYTFTWRQREQVTDDYELNLADVTDLDPYWWTGPSLGYVGSYRMESLPVDFVPGEEYGWWLWVYGPDGYGVSRYHYVVTFTNTGAGSFRSIPSFEGHDFKESKEYLRLPESP